MSKTLNVTRDTILSADVTRAMLVELAVAHCGYGKDAANELADKTLSKPSKLMAGLDCQKLRTVLCQKLEQVAGFTDGKFSHAFTCLKDDPAPDLDIGKAGANTGGAARGSKLTGKYKMGERKAGFKASEANTEKAKVYELLFANTDFATFFAEAEKAKLSKVVRQGAKGAVVITAAEFARWALKCQWIVRVA